jgi:hypothetical protein
MKVTCDGLPYEESAPKISNNPFKDIRLLKYTFKEKYNRIPNMLILTKEEANYLLSNDWFKIVYKLTERLRIKSIDDFPEMVRNLKVFIEDYTD